MENSQGPSIGLGHGFDPGLVLGFVYLVLFYPFSSLFILYLLVTYNNKIYIFPLL